VWVLSPADDGGSKAAAAAAATGADFNLTVVGLTVIAGTLARGRAYVSLPDGSCDSN